MRFVGDYRQLFPDESSLSTDNDYLSKLAIPTPTYFDSVRDFHRQYSSKLKQFNRSAMPPTTLKSLQKVDNILKSVDNYLNDYPHNPQRFNVLHGFKRIINADYGTKDYRVQTLLSKLEQVPLFYETAKQRLSKVNRQSADAAVDQHLATFLFFEQELSTFLQQNEQIRGATSTYQPKIEAAKLAIKDYAAYVESFRLN
ncbi:MAG: hypothetical protein U5L45_08655 [Saprospiraceae bacterium]|nr:hypothetical protein [Saprospiraceae bacterium]